MLASLNNKLGSCLLSWRAELVAVLCCTVIYQLFTRSETFSLFAKDPIDQVLMMLGLAVFTVSGGVSAADSIFAGTARQEASRSQKRRALNPGPHRLPHMTTLPKRNPFMSQHIEFRPSPPRSAVHCALVVAAWVLMGSAHAQVDVRDKDAEDSLSNIDSTTGNIKKSASDILGQLRNSTQDLGFTATLTPSNGLQKIGDVSGYVTQACPRSSGSAAGAGSGASGQPLTSLTTISAAGGSDMLQRICQELIQLRVQSFNETIDMANRFEQYRQQLAAIDNKRNSNNTHGDVQALTNEATRTATKLQAEMGFWRTRVAAYEAAIKFHEGQQNTLTKTAMKGSGSGGASASSFGRMNPAQLIQAASIAAALAVR